MSAKHSNTTLDFVFALTFFFMAPRVRFCDSWIVDIENKSIPKDLIVVWGLGDVMMAQITIVGDRPVCCHFRFRRATDIVHFILRARIFVDFVGGV
jgi:hypothetical protein